jgi:hypothetical protein
MLARSYLLPWTAAGLWAAVEGAITLLAGAARSAMTDLGTMNELTLAKSAFVAAHGRFLEGHSSRDVSLWYAGLGETIWWIVALDEHYHRLHGRRYNDFREASEYGRQIQGIRYARNLVGHEIVQLLDDQNDKESFSSKIEAGRLVILEQLTWRRLEDLPEPDPKHEQPKQRKAYGDYLAGCASRYALRRANYFFIRQGDGLDAEMCAE